MFLRNEIQKYFGDWFFILFCFGCISNIEKISEQKNEFVELRIRRWTALEGGEIFILRRVDNDWSANLLGDGVRFSCQYNKSVKPKSSWNNLWNSLKKDGLLEIPEGDFGAFGWEDGSGYDVEVFHQNELKRFSFFLPDKMDTNEAKQMSNIGELVSREFNTPMFKSDYSRNEVGNYLIANCEKFKKDKQFFCRQR